MFLQFKKINNESGVVLFIVLMVAIIIMIVSVGILTQSMNESDYAQQQVDQIVSEQLAKGIFWNAYSTAMNSQNMTNLQDAGAVTINEGGTNGSVGRVYNVTMTTNMATGTPVYNVVTSFNAYN